MKITYLHQYFATPQSSTGTRSYEFARRLIANGHKVHIITSSAHLPADFQLTKQTKNTEILGIPATIIPISYSNHMSFGERIVAFICFAVLASYYTMRHRADVIYATSTPLTIAIPAIAGRLWQCIPMVFEVRDLWPELPIAVGALSNPILRWLTYTLEWAAYHSASHIVALSPGMAEGVMRRGIPHSRVTVIPNSSDVDKFDVLPEKGTPIRAQLKLAADQPLIIYAGSFGLINDVGYLVRVAAAMITLAPDVRFLLVGDGAERKKIEQLANDHNVLNKNLTLWDPKPKDQMPALFAAATMTTSVFQPITSMWNNSANKFFDSLAAGKPIAINYGGWQAELLNETGAGIVLPYSDPTQAAQLMAEFIYDEERLAQARQAAHDLAYHQFNRDLLAQQLENILKQVTREA